MKRESAFTTKFRRWLMLNGTWGAYEIKHTRKKTFFLMRELRQHQLDALVAAESSYGFAYKIPDDGISYKPFDLFFLKNANAYVAIAYPKEFVIIRAGVMAALKEKGLTTLTLPDAKKYAQLVVPLKDM